MVGWVSVRFVTAHFDRCFFRLIKGTFLPKNPLFYSVLSSTYRYTFRGSDQTNRFYEHLLATIRYLLEDRQAYISGGALGDGWKGVLSLSIPHVLVNP